MGSRTFGIFGTRLMAMLTALFNVLALNLALVLASLPLITAPVAVSAASAALDRWARDGEDRVVRQFLLEFRARWSARTLLSVGVPVAAVLAGLAEVRYFWTSSRGVPSLGGFCLGGGALFVTLAALGYVFQLSADSPELSPLDLWSRSARLAVRNLLMAGPLSAMPAAGLALLAARDPAVLLLGLPVFLLHALKLIARPGLAAEPGVAAPSPDAPGDVVEGGVVPGGTR
ncbi:MAG TPA: hypothetical protein VMI73_03445 [Trebonia sp.]|nr:hypothetical protein [Trebonia sp.]